MLAQLIKHLNPKVKDTIRERERERSNLWADKTS